MAQIGWVARKRVGLMLGDEVVGVVVLEFIEHAISVESSSARLQGWQLTLGLTGSGSLHQQALKGGRHCLIGCSPLIIFVLFDFVRSEPPVHRPSLL